MNGVKKCKQNSGTFQQLTNVWDFHHAIWGLKNFPLQTVDKTTVPQDSNEPTNSATGFFFLTVSNNMAVCNNKMYFADWHLDEH